MSNVLNPETESITLNTELETPILEPATEQEQPSFESTSNPETAATPEAIAPVALDADATTEPVAQAAPEAPAEAAEIPVHAEAAATPEAIAPVALDADATTEPVAQAAPEAPAEAAEIPAHAEAAAQAEIAPVAQPHAPVHVHHGEHGESMEDFSAALEAFEREQAAEAAAVEAYGDKVVSGTVIKQTDKHLVVDVGLKSEGLVPIEQVVDHTGAVRFNPGDVIDVVIEREEPEGGISSATRRRSGCACGTRSRRLPTTRRR
jgi:small subunit ribosomal protein S1